MATPTQAHALLTLADFEALPNSDDLELDEGRLIEMSAPKFGNSTVAQQCFRLLMEAERVSQSGRAYHEVPYLLSEDPWTLRRPDVSFLALDRVHSTPEDEYIRRAPELAVEVISPSDSAEELERRTRQYFEAGAKLVWQIYPETRTVHVYRADGSAAVLDQQGALTAPELFAGWSTPVAALFER